MNNDIYLFNYIKGNKLDNIDELHNDYKFMMKVIDITSDKKYYEFCSSKVIKHYDFVNFLIKKFNNDLEFITYAVRFCLENNNPGDNEYKEILINVITLLKENKHDLNYTYLNEFLNARYLTEIRAIKNYKKNYPEFSDIVGTGFVLIKKNYRGNYLILDYFAKKIIEKIFSNGNKCILEDLIHNNFNSYNELKEYGINKFLINYIENYDMYLADYIRCNVSLLDDVKLKLNDIEQNFENFIKKEESNLVNFERAKKKFIK